MKFIIMLLAFLLAGFFAFQQFKPKPAPPPPPPPPPAIELEPTPVINPEEQEKVMRSTNDMDADVRWEAIVFLDKMKSPQAYPIMFEKLHRDSEMSVRLKIVHLLQERKGAAITQNLVQSLTDQEPEIRIAVLQALDRIGDYSTASAITGLLRDQEETVRVQALRTLNSLQDKKAADIAAEQQRQDALRQQAEEAAKKK